jgi:hypothetical protein
MKMKWPVNAGNGDTFDSIVQKNIGQGKLVA